MKPINQQGIRVAIFTLLGRVSEHEILKLFYTKKTTQKIPLNKLSHFVQLPWKFYHFCSSTNLQPTHSQKSVSELN
jgi:hypothetical protein